MNRIDEDIVDVVSAVKEIAKQLKIANRLKAYELKHEVSKTGTTVVEDLDEIIDDIF